MVRRRVMRRNRELDNRHRAKLAKLEQQRRAGGGAYAYHGGEEYREKHRLGGDSEDGDGGQSDGADGEDWGANDEWDTGPVDENDEGDDFDYDSESDGNGNASGALRQRAQKQAHPDNPDDIDV